MNTKLDLARAILRDAVNNILSDSNTYRRHSHADVMEVANSIEAMFGASPTANPNYACFADLVIEIVNLWSVNPIAYAALMRGITKTEDGQKLDHVDGFFGFYTMIAAIRDDHDYVLDSTNGVPALHLCGSLSHFEPTITPASLLAALRSQSASASQPIG